MSDKPKGDYTARIKREPVPYVTQEEYDVLKATLASLQADNKRYGAALYDALTTRNPKVGVDDAFIDIILDHTQGVALIARLLSKEGEKMRPEVKAFAELMEAQLAKHDDRPGWKDESVRYLFTRLGEEVDELFDALQEDTETMPPPDCIQIGEEAADVANFAMMIADVCGALLLNEGEP